MFHKTVVDWLTGEVDEQSSIKERSDVFQVERRRGHARFADGFEAWIGKGLPVDAVEDGTEKNAKYCCRDR